MIDVSFVEKLAEDLKKKRRKSGLEIIGIAGNLIDMIGVGITDPNLKRKLEFVGGYAKDAFLQKMEEDKNLMDAYVTSYTPTFPAEERKRAGQYIKKQYYGMVEQMYLAKAIGQFAKFFKGKPKPDIRGVKEEFAPTTKTPVKPAPTSEAQLQQKFESELMKKTYTKDWWHRKVPQKIIDKARTKVTEYLKGYAPYGARVTGVTPSTTNIQTAIAKEPTIIKELTKAGLKLDEALREIAYVSKRLIQSGAPTNIETFTKAMNTVLKSMAVFIPPTAERPLSSTETAKLAEENLIKEPPPGAIVKTPETGEKPLTEEVYGKPTVVPKPKPTPTEPIDIKEPEEIPEITEFLKDVGDIGQPGQVRLTPFIDGYKKLHKTIFTHGEAQLEDKVLYKKLMSRFHRSSAAVEKAIWKVDKVRENIVITPEEDTQMGFAYEDKKYVANLQHKEFYKKLYNLNQQAERAKLKLGIIKKRFQDRMIEDNDALIKDLIEEQKIIEPTSEKAVVISEQIKALQSENERFKNMRYLYHNAIVDRIIENRIEGLEGEERRIFIDKLVRYSFKYGRRVGKVTLKDYVDVGLLKPEDVRLTKLTIENLDSYYRKAAIQSLHDLAIGRELIKPYSQRLINEGWATPREAGITAFELKGKLLHPLYANALGEIREMKMARGGKLRQLYGAVKVAQFIKPSILLFYDGVQAIIRGMYSINPITMTKLYAKATHIVMSKSARYNQLNSLGLFQHPMEMPRAAREEMIEMAVRQMGTNMPGAVKILEKITNMSWKEWYKNPFSVFMSPIRTLANVAWTGDKIIRTTSVLALEKMGYPTAEAVERAAKGHGAYSMLSPKYKKFMGWVAFVHSFRVLMPIEMGKILLEPVMESVKAVKGGKPIPKHRLESMAKAIIGTLIIPAGIELYMKMRGFKRDKLGWKWKKEIIDPDTGEKREVVVALNYILNMPLKWYHRATYYNPIRATPRPLQALYNLVKWEVHPIYRIFDDVVINKRSIGGETEQVYNPTGTEPEKAWQVITYIMQQSFRHIEVVTRAFITGKMIAKEKKIQDRIMDKAFNNIEKLFLGRASPLGVGYSYVRENKQEMGRMWLSILNNEFKSKVTQLHLKYDPSPERNKMIKEYMEWRERCIKWIERTYDYKIPDILKARIEGMGTIPTAGIKKEEKAPLTVDFVRQLHDSLVGAELR